MSSGAQQPNIVCPGRLEPRGKQPPERKKGQRQGKDQRHTQDSEEATEAALQLWETADPVQPELLVNAGLSKPQLPQPELAELCRWYEDTLPKEIQEALAAIAAAEPKPTRSSS